MTPEQEIRLFSANIPFGSHARTVCPSCGGGRDREKSLSVSKGNVGEVSWVCFRSSCGYRGGAKASWIDADSPAKLQRIREYHHKLEFPDDYVKAKFQERYGFKSDAYRWCSDTFRFIQPFLSPTRKLRGYMSRTLPNAFEYPDDAPKALAYPLVSDEPFMHWTDMTKPNKIVIAVEDWVSAEKAASGLIRSATCVALGGTYLDYTRAIEIAHVANKRTVLLALDMDATAVAARYVTKFREVIPNLVLYPLIKDIKDLSYSEIYRIVKDGESFSSG